ncbi:NAD(P)/FAD-dependent oxidoreductase [Sulfoacidibacillus thermotolerans]|uniref:Sulfide-quinone oxidoreductase n=1 Tax=Sulfoacidibacillus thermotolerans TaxID=1765684 RepID=A0A2U3DAT1_SULT2|nr:FAD-dependent oxidoreductase [Sulfoacidibacillus thermotolerans]PWI58372.1 sulfide-quinone oxidoreductase [Sulfoacidibacillus thermotolerans]
MHKLVILGGGFGGLTVFHHVAKWAREYQVEITVIDERETFLVKPSLPEVSLGEKSVREITFPLRQVVESYGTFIRNRVNRIDPVAQKVYLEEGVAVSYDFLVIALGAKKHFGEIPGFADYGHSMCTDVLAPRLAKAIEQFDKGNIVIGSMQVKQATRLPEVPYLKAACEGPVGEVAFMIDVALRKRGKRDDARVVCFSPSPIFFEDVGDKVHEAFGDLAQKHQVEVITDKIVRKIERDYVEFDDGSTLESALTIMIPAYYGPDAVANSGLGDEAGFAPTNEQFQHLDYANIYAIGDGASRTVPKLGHLAVEQGNVVASHLKQTLTGRGEVLPYEPEVFCIMNMGNRKAMLIRSNTLYGGQRDFAYYGQVSSLMKSSFDEYMLRFKGKMPPDMLQRLLNVYLGRLE